MTNAAPTVTPANPAAEKKILLGCASLVLLIVALCVGYGLYLLQPSRETIQYAKASPDWPTTTAKVTSARVAFLEGATSTSGKSRWTPEVTYTYTVDGILYEGNTIRFAYMTYTKGGARDLAQAVITPYANFPEVKVSYHPEDPQISVLEPGTTTRSYSLVIDAAGFILIGLVILGVLLWFILPRKSDKK